jgi:hypothetical protein
LSGRHLVRAPANLAVLFVLPGRHLLDHGNALIKELNIVGHTIVPNVILPKPAISVNIAKPTKQQQQPSIKINGNHGVSLV